MKNEKTRLIPYNIRITDEGGVSVIHEASIEYLATEGAMFESETAVQLLLAAGCERADNGKIKIPKSIISQAIETAPNSISMFSRTGEERMILDGNNVYCGTGSDCPYVIDFHTKERRKCLKSDIETFTRLSDALKNIDFILSMGLASDVPNSSLDLHHFQAMVCNTTKPIFFTVLDDKNMPKIIEMASIIVGGLEILQAKPFICHFAMPSPPFNHSPIALANLIYCAENNIPVVYASGTQIGTSGPMSLAGSTVSSNIDVLAGLVVHQLAKPGAPFIYGVCVAPFDMQTTIEAYGAPEHYPGDALNVEIAKHYDLPTWGYGANTDSKVLDLQAGMEYMGSTMMGMLSNCNLLHDVGYLESGMTASCESIVYGNSIIENCRRILQPVPVDDKHIALESFKKITPGKTFLTQKFTMKHYRDFWYSPLIDRQRHHNWEKDGRKTMGDRIREKVNELLKSHEPEPLDSVIIGKLENIIRENE